MDPYLLGVNNQTPQQPLPQQPNNAPLPPVPVTMQTTNHSVFSAIQSGMKMLTLTDASKTMGTRIQQILQHVDSSSSSTHISSQDPVERNMPIEERYEKLFSSALQSSSSSSSSSTTALTTSVPRKEQKYDQYREDTLAYRQLSIIPYQEVFPPTQNTISDVFQQFWNRSYSPTVKAAYLVQKMVFCTPCAHPAIQEHVIPALYQVIKQNPHHVLALTCLSALLLTTQENDCDAVVSYLDVALRREPNNAFAKILSLCHLEKKGIPSEDANKRICAQMEGIASEWMGCLPTGFFQGWVSLNHKGVLAQTSTGRLYLDGYFAPDYQKAYTINAKNFTAYFSEFCGAAGNRAHWQKANFNHNPALHRQVEKTYNDCLKRCMTQFPKYAPLFIYFESGERNLLWEKTLSSSDCTIVRDLIEIFAYCTKGHPDRQNKASKF